MFQVASRLLCGFLRNSPLSFSSFLVQILNDYTSILQLSASSISHGKSALRMVLSSTTTISLRSVDQPENFDHSKPSVLSTLRFSSSWKGNIIVPLMTAPSISGQRRYPIPWSLALRHKEAPRVVGRKSDTCQRYHHEYVRQVQAQADMDARMQSLVIRGAVTGSHEQGCVPEKEHSQHKAASQPVSIKLQRRLQRRRRARTTA